jgi:hypothetical protein
MTVSKSYQRIEFFGRFMCDLPSYLEKMGVERGRACLSYEEAVQLGMDLGQQLFYMEKRSAGWLYLNKSKVFVIGGSASASGLGLCFVYLDEDVKPILGGVESESFRVTVPLTKRELGDAWLHFAPEVEALSSLPHNINRRCVYWSLGSLVGGCLSSVVEIEGTKLYWFILRCMREEAVERSVVFF